MTARRPTTDLVESLRRPGFIPRRVDLDALLGMLAGHDEDLALHAERALARMGPEVATRALRVLEAASAPLRGRICRLLGRIAIATGDARARDVLIEHVNDADPKTRRNAVIALGKLGGARRSRHSPAGEPNDPQRAPTRDPHGLAKIERALLAAIERAESVSDRKAIVSALGKSGSASALDRVSHIESKDPELSRVREEASLRLSRAKVSERGAIDLSRTFAEPTTVRLRCRRGLEDIVIAEVTEAHAGTVAKAKASSARPSGERRGALRGDAIVEVSVSGSLDAIRALRTPLRFGFPLLRASGDPVDVVVRALTSPLADRIVSTFTTGPARYRLEWASAGHQRRATFEVAKALSKLRPNLLNDPTETLWEVLVTADGDAHAASVDVELWPRGLADERFAYRVSDVPGASHPTIAAALARVAGVRADDVVWDPFVGGGSELIERALLGPCARMFGTDLSADFIAVARKNLDAAKKTADLFVADARTFRPPAPVTLVITNPPMGRRVLTKDALRPLFDAVVHNVANVARSGARLVWVSPLFAASVRSAEAAGFRQTNRSIIDMGGFSAELQAFVLGSTARTRPRARG